MAHVLHGCKYGGGRKPQASIWLAAAAQKIPAGSEGGGRGLVFNPPWKRAGAGRAGPFVFYHLLFLSSPSPSPSPCPSPSPPPSPCPPLPTPHSHLRIPAAALPHFASLAIAATSLDLPSIPRAPILTLAWVGYGLERGLLGPARVIYPRAGSPLAHHAEDPVAAGAPFSLLLCARARARL